MDPLGTQFQRRLRAQAHAPRRPMRPPMRSRASGAGPNGPRARVRRPPCVRRHPRRLRSRQRSAVTSGAAKQMGVASWPLVLTVRARNSARARKCGAPRRLTGNRHVRAAQLLGTRRSHPRRGGGQRTSQYPASDVVNMAGEKAPSRDRLAPPVPTTGSSCATQSPRVQRPTWRLPAARYAHDRGRTQGTSRSGPR